VKEQPPKALGIADALLNTARKTACASMGSLANGDGFD
jgi:hypothetical protein